MPKFNVIVAANATVYTTVEVEADNAEAAEQRALQEVVDMPSGFGWVHDDGDVWDAFIPDPGKSATPAETEGQ